MHNSVSLDGSFINFEYPPDLMGIHYQIAAGFGKSIRLFGSNTAKVSIDLFGGFTPETKEDFNKPQKKDDPSNWVVVDSKASLKNKLHYFRRSEYCRDIIVLVSEETDKDYIKYLQSRNYDHYVVGKKRVDLAKAIELIAKKYDCNIILVDSGRELTNALINQNLISEISLLIIPVIVGGKAENLFTNVLNPKNLTLVKEEKYPGGYIHVSYKVVK